MSASNRKRRKARRTSFRNTRERFLIVCEGSVTEPTYIKGLVRFGKNAAVEVICSEEHGAPLTVVQIALREKRASEKAAKRAGDRYLRFDYVWCVYDVDEHPYLNDAMQLARANGIELAISNPCFELWLLLHFREQPGMRHRHDLQRMMKGFIREYDKNLQFSEVQAGVRNAISRAADLERIADEEGELGRNPSTGMHALATALLPQDQN